MTLAEALANTRRNCGLTTVDMPTTDLTNFVQNAEVEVAIALLEKNAPLAFKQDVLTIPSGSGPVQTFALTTANVASLGSNRTVHKIVSLSWLSLPTAFAYQRVAMTNHPVELSGSVASIPNKPYTASPMRILFDGAYLRIYPVQSMTTYLLMGYTRMPVAQTTLSGTILADFPAGSPAHLADTLVCMKAASDALATWGWDNTWQEGRVTEMLTALVAPLGNLQLAEATASIGSRWQLDYWPGA